jgi:hypothetical protein
MQEGLEGTLLRALDVDILSFSLGDDRDPELVAAVECPDWALGCRVIIQSGL